MPSFYTAFGKKYGDKKNWPKVAVIIVGKVSISTHITVQLRLYQRMWLWSLIQRICCYEIIFEPR